jgi:septum formation protein
MKKPIILASASPRRFELMRQIGIDPMVITSEINENWDGKINGRELAIKLALKKAQACANKVKEGIIISADTVVMKGNQIFGKPKDLNQAVEMLSSLRGTSHSVITGVAVLELPGRKLALDYEETEVFFRSLTDEEIRSYINWGESLDKAGAYGIQGKGALLVEKISGDYFNVVGLPLQKLNKMLQEFDLNLLLNAPYGSETAPGGEN